MTAPPSPELSVVIPIYNEEAILHSAVVDLVDRLGELDRRWEILLSENGSTDGTVAIAEELREKYASLELLRTGEPNYGKALRAGILAARAPIVFCDEIDLCDVRFYKSALPLLEGGGADLVVGSKAMAGARDRRPAVRRLATHVLNGLLRTTVGYRGTDTHGLKAFRRDALVGTAERCKVERDLFASEFVIRAYREGKRVVEIPVEVLEKRTPSINLVRRVPNVLGNLARLTWLFRVEDRS